MNCESCKSMHCSLHSDEIEDYSMKICKSIEFTVYNHRQNRKRTMPGWKEFVRIYIHFVHSHHETQNKCIVRKVV